MSNDPQKDKGTILVTGGTGLLGAYVLRELLRHDQPIRAIYRERYPQMLSKQELSRIEWMQGDILDPMLLEEQMEGVEELYHCAGVVSFHPRRKNDMMKINVEGTANVVNAALAAGVRKMVHVSSVSALGRKRDNETVTESSKWSAEANLSNYGESKFLAEMEVWRGISEGLEAVIVNPTIILGYGNWNSGSAAIFKNAHQEFPWYTDGVSGFVDASDVARTMWLLMKGRTSGECFIINGQNLTFRRVFTEIALAFGKKAPHLKVTPLIAGLVWRWEKMKSMLTGSEPLLTRETAHTARLHVYFDNSKVIEALPGFQFQEISEIIPGLCKEYSAQSGANKP